MNQAVSIIECFSEVEDPRVSYLVRHKLIDIIVIAICAVISGAEGWTDVESFGRAREKWLRKFLELPNGIPSHDTFGDVFGLIDARQFQTSFLQWVQVVNEVTTGQVIPFDGKKLRRSHHKTIGKAAIEMVSAWAAENRLVLGQVKVDEQSNEISAIPELLDLLEISGCIVTIDAIGCQTKIAQQIIDQDADYVLALKGNQGNLYDSVKNLFDYAQETGFVDCDYHKTVNKGHGRIEIRECWTLTSPEYLAYLPDRSVWPTLQTLGMVRSERRIGVEKTVKFRYYISSLTGDAQQLLHAVRTHWTIENELHWVLDVAFHEDDCRIRTGNAAENMAVLRHIALNLLKQEKSAKCGIKAKRLRAAWDQDYLLKILSV